MTQLPEVTLTIVIPAFNAQSYIERCIRSCYNLVRQRESLDIIVVDDGSTDKTINRVTGLTAEFPALRIISKQNGGAASARNCGLSKSTGEYVWFVDADDWIEKGSVDEVLEKLRIHRPDACYIGYRKISEQGIALGGQQHMELTEDIVSGTTLFSVCGSDFIMPPRYIVRRNIYTKNKLKYVEGISFEDSEFAPRLLYFLESVVIVEKPIYNYVIRSGSTMRSSDSRRVQSFLTILDNLNQFRAVSSKNSDFQRSLSRYILELASAYLGRRHEQGDAYRYTVTDIEQFKSLDVLQPFPDMGIYTNIKYHLIRIMPHIYSCTIRNVNRLRSFR